MQGLDLDTEIQGASGGSGVQIFDIKKLFCIIFLFFSNLLFKDFALFY